jgi:hypothetical protein
VTRADRQLFAALLALVLLSIPVTTLAVADSGSVASVVAPSGTTRIPLGTDARYTIQGRHGEVVVVVSDGALRCVESSCDDQVCVRAGELSPGRPIVCAPNGVSISTVGGGDDLDAVSR